MSTQNGPSFGICRDSEKEAILRGHSGGIPRLVPRDATAFGASLTTALHNPKGITKGIPKGIPQGIPKGIQKGILEGIRKKSRLHESREGAD